MFRCCPHPRNCPSVHNRINLKADSTWSILMLLLVHSLFGTSVQFNTDYPVHSAQKSPESGHRLIRANESQLPLSPDELEYTRLEQADARTRLYGSNYGPDLKTKVELPEDLVGSYRSMLSSYGIQSPNESDHPAVPKFLHQPPPILYASKGQPATFHCVAQPVVLLYSVCTINLSGDSMHRTHKDSDSHMAVPALTSKGVRDEFRRKNVSEDIRHVSQHEHLRWEVTRYITAQTVEEWFGDFWCHCEAWNNVLEFGEPRVVVTPRTYIQLAYLEKRFVRQPTSASILIGWRAEFFCDAPEGRPMPQVYWYKNTERLKAKTSDNRISIEHPLATSRDQFTTEGSRLLKAQVDAESIHTAPSNEPHSKGLPGTSTSRLTIHKTKLTDEGNYVCVAENIAGRRVSNPARLTIHADGRWSEWSEWSACPTECLGSIGARGPQSVGNVTQTAVATGCPSYCQNHLTQRQRYCNAPEPHGGGRPCAGFGVEKTSCSKYCLYVHSNSDRNQYSLSAGTKNEEISLLVVLAFAVSVFMVATCCVVYLFLRKFCSRLIRPTPGKSLENSLPTTEMIELGVACITPPARTPLRRWSMMSSIPMPDYGPMPLARSDFPKMQNSPYRNAALDVSPPRLGFHWNEPNPQTRQMTAHPIQGTRPTTIATLSSAHSQTNITPSYWYDYAHVQSLPYSPYGARAYPTSQFPTSSKESPYVAHSLASQSRPIT